MHVVRRNDGDRLDAVLALPLGLGHFGEGAVAAGRIETEIGCGRLGARRIGRQRAGHQRELAIDARRDAVHTADKGALPAANHAVADWATARFNCLAGYHWCFPF